MTTQPKIELRKISQNERLSEETNCYSADLYVDGAYWGQVSNHGHGGADDWHPGKSGKTWDDMKALDELIGATYPEEDLASVGAPGTMMKQSLEGLCGEIVADFLIQRDLKRAMKRAVLFTKPEKPGAIFEYSMKKHSPDAIFAHIERTLPEAVVLNKLPFDEALALFKKAA